MNKLVPLVVLVLLCHAGWAVDSSESNESKNKDGSGSDENTLQDTKLGKRIIGGETARPGEYLYVARLILRFNNSEYYSLCSGTVLSDRVVLTAAHCVYGTRANFIQEIFVQVSGKTYPFSIDDVYIHPRYRGYFNDDIAILKKSSTPYLTGYGTPPRLPNARTTSDIFTNPSAIVAGWGVTSDTSSVSSTLQYANVDVISNQLCRSYYGSIITPRTICSMNSGSTKGICGGDSGGPLIIIRDGGPYVVGVNGFRSSVCEMVSPSGYAYVAKFIGWLNNII